MPTLVRRFFASRLAMLALSLLLTAGSLWIVFGQADLGRLLHAVRALPLWPFAFSLLGLLLGTLLRAGRLTVLLHRRGVTFLIALETILTGYLFTTLMPLRTGEVMRIAFLARRSGVANATAVAAIGVERVVDLIALAILAAIFLSGFAGRRIPEMPLSPSLLAMLASAGMAIAMAIGWLARRRFAGQAASADGRVGRLVRRLLQGAEALGSFREALLLLGLSLGLWLLVSLSIKIAFLAIPYRVPYADAVVVLLGTCFAIALPASPGFIGTYHLGFVTAALLVGIPREVALPVAVVFHLVIQVPFIPVGGLILYLRRRKLLAPAADPIL